MGWLFFTGGEEMEERVLQGYLEFQKKRESSIKEFWAYLNMGTKIGFISMVISLIVLIANAILLGIDKLDYTIGFRVSLLGATLEGISIVWFQKSQQKLLVLCWNG